MDWIGNAPAYMDRYPDLCEKYKTLMMSGRSEEGCLLLGESPSLSQSDEEKKDAENETSPPLTVSGSDKEKV